MSDTSLQRAAVAALLIVGLAAVLPAEARVQTRTSTAAAPAIEIVPLSTRADRVTGGDVLLSVRVPGAGTAASRPPTVTLNGRDILPAFLPTDGGFMGLLTGLALGPNVVVVSGAAWGVPDASLTLTNYPSIGPVVSGPHQQPFICQTEEFALPDGTRLGPPLDEHCTIATRVQHVYRSSGGEFRPLPPGRSLPADIEMTTTLSGRRVPFIVRVETGSMNRGIYQNLVLHDPGNDPAPTPFSPPPAWNRRLIAIHGVGCPTGWYRQGGAMGVNPLSGVNVTRLGEGYAIFTNTLNHPTNSCNSFLAGETTMMGKERFIETFGVPSFTVSIGASGGAYTGLQVADAFPGLIDGVIATSTFPDALSIAIAGMDARLLALYFQGSAANRYTDEQQVAITGYSSVRAFIDAANQAQRTDPVADREEDIPGYSPARWHAAIPEEVRYHPARNPGGSRPTVFDAVRNVYGVDPETGFALRPFDNVGVQYGLGALNAGAITLADFLDLNERVGGFDHDSNPVASRSVGDDGAIRRANQAGVSLTGAGGLAHIPVMDAGGYNEASAYHYQWFHFAVRERMRLANGHADNHVLWRGAVPATETWQAMTEWLAGIHETGGPAGGVDAVIRARPAGVTDGCWVAGGEGEAATFVAEPQTFSSTPDTPCNEHFPSYSFVRQVAGGPLHGNNLRCRLKPIDAADYAVRLGADELARLRRIFPDGVCDWSRPGVGQVPVVPWASFGPAPEGRVEE